MALINRKAETATENQEVKTETAAAAQESQVKDDNVKAETKEVAVKKEAGPVASGASGFWFSNPMVQQVVETASFGDFPQIIASQGAFSEGGSSGKELGKYIMFRPIQAKVKKVCSPNSQDEGAKEFFAAAYVGELTMDGRTIEECLEAAKDPELGGYANASIKDYIDLFAYVVSCETNSEDFADEVVILQLSPMSKIEWQKFSKKLEMKAAFGKLEDKEFVIKAIAKATKNKANQSFSHYTFELA